MSPFTPVEEPLVSVVMPVYNGGSMLHAALESILSQTYRNLEVLVVDDGSTDDSAHYCLSQTDTRIRVIQNDGNQGLGFSLNRGIKEATGDYVAIMHADDLAMAQRIEKQVAYLEGHPEIGLCGGQILKRMNRRTYRVDYPLSHDEIYATHLFHTGFAHPAVMARRELYDNYDLYYRNDCNSVEDYELWTRLLEVTRGANLPDILIEYRVHDAQISVRNYKQMRALKRPIQRRILMSMGMTFTDEECDAHTRYSVSHESLTGEDVGAADNWFRRIWEANQVSGHFDDQALLHVLHKRWISLCGQCNPLSLAVFARYTSGIGFRLRSLATLKLLGRCVLGSTYR